MSRTINLRKLLSLSTLLTMEANKLMKDSIISTVAHYLKGENDPVTEMDYKIQTMLVNGFKMYFPHLKIIGEQSMDYVGSIDVDYSKLHQDILPKSFNANRELQNEQCCLWIDPIDCTSGFIKGNYEDVTILIGLSYREKAEAGIIGTPYKKINNQRRFEPKLTFGSVQQKQAFTYDQQTKNWNPLKKKQINRDPIIALSNSRGTKIQNSLAKELNASIIKAGGSGRKIMMVAEGQADAMLYLDNWTHKWDSCAGEAIIKSMGGSFTTPRGEDIRYQHANEDTHNKEGMIVALDQNLFESCTSKLKQLV